jgi:CubicO group peptidase (beta-lactamase class C family)
MRLLLGLPAALILSACAAAPEAGAQKFAADCSGATSYSDSHSGVAVRVMIDGVMACESYADGFSAGTAHPLFSGTKGLVGLTAAAAIQDGLLALDAPLMEVFPEWAGDPNKSRMTLRHLLSLSSGLTTTGPRAAPGYAEAAATPASHAPGEHFAYGPIVFQTFGEALRRALAAKGVNETPVAYMDRRVLRPIGARVSAWGGPTAGPDPNLAAGAQMSAEDWAKVGELVRSPARARQSGLDAEAFEAMGKPQGAYTAYGLTWWLATPLPASAREGLDPVARTVDLPQGAHAGQIPSDLIVAAGAGGQRLYVSRSLKLTVVRFADPPALAQRFAQAQSVAGRAQAATGTAGFSDTEFVRRVIAGAGLSQATK